MRWEGGWVDVGRMSRDWWKVGRQKQGRWSDKERNEIWEGPVNRGSIWDNHAYSIIKMRTRFLLGNLHDSHLFNAWPVIGHKWNSDWSPRAEMFSQTPTGRWREVSHTRHSPIHHFTGNQVVQGVCYLNFTLFILFAPNETRKMVGCIIYSSVRPTFWLLWTNILWYKTMNFSATLFFYG